MLKQTYEVTQSGRVISCEKIAINKYENKLTCLHFNYDDQIADGRKYIAILNPKTNKYRILPLALNNTVILGTDISRYPGIWQLILLVTEDDYEITNDDIDQTKCTYVSNIAKFIVIRDNFLSDDTIEEGDSPAIQQLIDETVAMRDTLESYALGANEDYNKTSLLVNQAQSYADQAVIAAQEAAETNIQIQQSKEEIIENINTARELLANYTTIGDGTKFLSDDGTYKTISASSSYIKNITLDDGKFRPWLCEETGIYRVETKMSLSDNPLLVLMKIEGSKDEPVESSVIIYTSRILYFYVSIKETTGQKTYVANQLSFEDVDNSFVNILKDGNWTSKTLINVLKTDGNKEYTPTQDYNPATKKYVDDSTKYKIDTPSIAEVGQTITVKSIDENGVPVQWETTDIPEKLPNPQKLTFAGAVTAEYDGSGAVTVTIPEGSGGSGGTVRIEKLSTDTSVELEPNKLYVFPEMAELSITLAEPSDTSIVSEYHFVFQSGATATVFSIPDTVKIPSGFSVEINKIYEISIMENCLACQSWAVSVSA